MAGDYSYSGSSFSFSTSNSSSVVVKCPGPSTAIITGVSVMCVVGAFGIVSNLALFLIPFLMKAFRTSPNALVTNLALADFLYLIVNAPFSIEHELFPCFQFGLIMCKIQNGFTVTTQAVTVFSLTAGAIERHFALLSRNPQSTSWNIVIFTICTIWAISLFLSIPTVLASHTVRDILCVPLPLFETSAKLHELLRFLFLYLLPLVIIAWCYTAIFRELQNSRQLTSKIYQSRHLQQARKRSAFVFLSIITLFAVCYLPYFVYNFIFHFLSELFGDSNKTYFVTLDVLRVVSQIAVFLRACLDPCAILIISTKHRRAIKRMWNTLAFNLRGAHSSQRAG